VRRILESGGVNSSTEEYFNIHWLLTYNCTYNCTYCFRYNVTNQKYLSKDKVNNIIDTLDAFPKEVGITLMGGEPLIYPDIDYIIDRLQNIKNLKFLHIFTNLSLDIPPPALTFNKKNRFKFFVSYHPTFVEKYKYTESFIEKLRILSEKDIETYIKLMLEHNYINEVRDMYEQLKSFIPSSHIHIIPLEPIEKQNYSEEYLDLEKYVNSIDKKNTYKSHQSCFLVYYIIQNDDKITKEIYTEEDMYKLPKFYHSFTTMLCHAGYHLTIDPYGDIYVRCDFATHDKSKVITLENIQDVIKQPRVCTRPQCIMRNDIRTLKKTRYHV